MSAVAVIESAALNVEDALSEVRKLADGPALIEVRARIEAARAWAKVHGTLKTARLDLLRVEVGALAQIARLEQLSVLPKRDRAAAKFYASLTDEQVNDYLRDAGEAVTTANGLYQTLRRLEQLEQRVDRGRHLAITPPVADCEVDPDHLVGIRAALADAVAAYTDEGLPFTVNEFATEVIDAAGASALLKDPALQQGVREVCRETIRRAPVLELEGTILPRTVTALIEGQYFRIPIENALLLHLDSMREMRREQIDQDRAALDRLDRVAEKLRALPNASDHARIGDLLLESLKDTG